MTNISILFQKPMVLALLAGTKTQTRRLIEPTNDPIRDGDIAVSEDGISARRFRPRFAVGDRLWVKENYRGPQVYETNGYKPKDWGNKPIWYVADGDPPAEHATFWSTRVRPSIHMPKWMSRLTLTVTEVRVQRLQEISQEDGYAEGIPRDYLESIHGPAGYRDLWDSINADRAPWESNPWIVAVSFTVERGNIDGVKT